MRLEKWSVKVYGTPCSAPEQMRPKLVGEISEPHPRLGHGGPITTSRPVDLIWHVEFGGEPVARIQTISGSLYELGDPDPEWVLYLAENSKCDPVEALQKFFDL